MGEETITDEVIANAKVGRRQRWQVGVEQIREVKGLGCGFVGMPTKINRKSKINCMKIKYVS